MEILAVILGLLLAISELLALFPAIKSNGIFQGIYEFLKSLKEKA